MKSAHCSLVVVVSLWLGTAANLHAQSYTFTTPAGNPLILDQYGYPAGGYADGTNSAARFNSPNAVAVDRGGTVYVADTGNDTIRKVTHVGNDWVVTTVAGAGPTSRGSADGTNGQAQFNTPFCVAVDRDGNLYVADTFNRVVRKITPLETNWVVSTIAGDAGAPPGTADGPGSAARFYSPVSVAVDSATNVYVADYTANTIRKLTPTETNWMVSTIAGSSAAGRADGTNDQAQFDAPGSLAVDGAGIVYVSDWNNYAIRRIAPVGTNYVVTTLAGTNEAAWVDGLGSQARFSSWLGGIAVDNATNLYVVDTNMVRKITPVGTNWLVTTIAGSPPGGWVDGTGSNARFCNPLGVAVDSTRNLYLADSGNHAIRLSVPRFVLQIAQERNSVILSWSLSAVDYVLETASTVRTGVKWTLLTNGVAVSGPNFVLTNSLGTTNALYRLRLPY